MDKENRRRWRLLPCADEDIQALEAWLTEQAEQGWYLTKDGFFGPLACFEERPCGPIRYRLEGALHKASFWTDHSDPDQEAIELSAAFGWDYVARIGQFYVYANTQEDPRDFHSEPEAQAIALQAVKRRLLDDAIYTLLWGVLCFFLSLRGLLLPLMLEVGTFFVLLMMGIILYHAARGVTRVVHMGKLRRILLEEGSLPPDPTFRKRTAAHHIREGVVLLLTIVFVIWGVSLWMRDISGEDRRPILEPGTDPPFATLMDMVPGDYDTMFIGMADSYRVWSDVLAPVAFDWDEAAEITRSDGSHLSASLYVQYYETVADPIARWTAQSWRRAARFERELQFLDLPDLGVDYACAYTCRPNIGTTLILQEGNKVMLARVHVMDEGLTMEAWSRALAESIKE